MIIQSSNLQLVVIFYRKFLHELLMISMVEIPQVE